MDTYEKKYKEIVGKLKKTYLYAQTDSTKAVLEEIFPELKESEDERIRKGLIKAVSRTFEGNKLFGTDVTREEALAWLEKQDRRNNDEMLQAISIGLSDIKEDVGWSDFGGTPIEEIQEWLEKQGEQKPQRMISAEAKEAMYGKPAWREEDKDFMYDTLSNLTELKNRYGEGYGNVGKCIDWLTSLKQRIGG